jgi:hypothetical protein
VIQLPEFTDEASYIKSGIRLVLGSSGDRMKVLNSFSASRGEESQTVQ